MKKRTLTIGAVALATSLAGGWALAQSGPGGPGGFGPPFMRGQGGFGPGMMRMGHGMGPWMMRGQGGPTFANPTQVEALKKEIGITAAQEPAWAKYSQEIRDAATSMTAARKDLDFDAIGKMSPPERFAVVSKLREQGLKRFEAVTAAANELVATLNDGQKAKAKDVLPGLASFGPSRMRGAFMGGPWQYR